MGGRLSTSHWRAQFASPPGLVPKTDFGRPPIEQLDEEYTPEERVNIFVYDKCNRSVVNINTKGSAGTALFVIDIPSEGAGSGSVLDKRGHILTNFHVVEDAREIQVTLFDSVGFAIEDFSALRHIHGRLQGTGLFQQLDMIADPDDPRDLFGMLCRAEAVAAA